MEYWTSSDTSGAARHLHPVRGEQPSGISRKPDSSGAAASCWRAAERRRRASGIASRDRLAVVFAAVLQARAGGPGEQRRADQALQRDRSWGLAGFVRDAAMFHARPGRDEALRRR